MRPIRRFTGFIRRQEGFRKVLTHQLLLAALLTLLAFSFAVVFNASMSYMGNKDDAAAAFVLQNFWHVILFTQLKILLVYVGGFALIGACCGLLLHAAFFAFGRRPEGGAYRLSAVLVPIVFYLHWFGYSVLQWPTAYSRTLFEKGGVRRALQLFLTDGPGIGYYTLILALAAAGAALVLVLALRRMAAAGRFSGLLSRFRRLSVRARILLGAGGVLFLLLSLQLLLPEGAPAPGRRKNLLIIAADALRPDRLSMNGYKRPTSPGLDRYFSAGVSFERVFAEVPRTFPAWVTMPT